MHTARISGALLVLLLAGCGSDTNDETAHDSSYASTYTPAGAETVAIVNATALTGTGERINAAAIVMADGRINAVGAGLAPRPSWTPPGNG